METAQQIAATLNYIGWFIGAGAAIVMVGCATWVARTLKG